MIDATPENFEAGISQTQEYALISLFFNIKQMVVVVNKMDDETVNFSQIRFNEIKNEMTKILVEIGYKPDQYQFVPASGFSGDNLIEKSSNLSWWTGKTLLETLDTLNESVQQNYEKPLRFLIRKVFNVSGVGTVVTGSVASGMMKPGMRVTFPLSNITSEVKSIEMFHTKIGEAVPYNIVGVCIDEDASSIVKRDVCGEANRNRPLECIGFTAKLMIKNHPGKIYVGYEPILYCRAGRVQCKFEKFIQRINRYHGNKVIENPEWIQKDDAAVVDIRLSKSIFVEPFKEFNNLGSFVLRDNNQTVAVGFFLIVDKKPHFLKKRHNVTPVW